MYNQQKGGGGTTTKKTVNTANFETMDILEERTATVEFLKDNQK